jgi:protein-L-isoaspartate(D-aspartate) O-methyltransferase
MTKEAGKRLSKLGIHNVSLTRGDLVNLPLGSFDVIMVGAGALPERNTRLEQALTGGGRLFAVIGTGRAMEACLVTRNEENRWHCDSLFETEVTLLGTGDDGVFRF